MSAAREKDNADFDLEAFIDLFDEALTSDDPSVQKTLQHLMVICALARNHDGHSARSGPLRRLFDDQANILRRLERLEISNTRVGGTNPSYPGGYNPSTPYGPIPTPYVPPLVAPGTAVPGTGTSGWPGMPPNQIWCGTSTSATSISLASDSSVAKTSVIPTLTDVVSAKTSIAERVDGLLKSSKYKGSSVGANDVS